MHTQSIWNFFFELAHLRRIKHEGWRLIGVDHPESVAEHSLRAAQIGYVLALLEGYERPEEIASMLIFHDMGEARIGDLHRVANRYVTADEAKAVNEQLAPLETIGTSIEHLWRQIEERSTPAGIIAKDADYIEQAAVAKEYVERGYISAQDWIHNVTKAVRTQSAKNLMAALAESNSNDWWQGLKKMKPGDTAPEISSQT